jgi:hypothetical protein
MTMDARLYPKGFGWEPIDTAPIDKDITLLVTDGASEFRIPYPCRLSAAVGWVNSGNWTALTVRPIKWKSC